MGKAPAFLLYAADFYMDTNSWTVAQVGAYFRLLMYEWVNGSLPNSVPKLARIAGCDTRNMHKMWSAELAKKFTTDDAGMLVNKRMEEVRSHQKSFQEKQSIKGRKSAEKRWSENVTTVTPRLQPEDNISFSSSSSKEKNKEQGKKPPLSESEQEAVKHIASVVDKLKVIYPAFNSYKFIGSNNKAHKGAMLHTLESLLRAHDSGIEIGNVWAYATSTLRIENGKHNARDYEARSQDYKKPGMMSFGDIVTAANKSRS